MLERFPTANIVYVSQSTSILEPPSLEPLWDLERTAKYLGLEVEYVRKLAANDPEFPAKKIGKYWRCVPSKVVAWAESS